jgi:hypothetical protein
VLTTTAGDSNICARGQPSTFSACSDSNAREGAHRAHWSVQVQDHEHAREEVGCDPAPLM